MTRMGLLPNSVHGVYVHCLLSGVVSGIPAMQRTATGKFFPTPVQVILTCRKIATDIFTTCCKPVQHMSIAAFKRAIIHIVYSHSLQLCKLVFFSGLHVPMVGRKPAHTGQTTLDLQCSHRTIDNTKFNVTLKCSFDFLNNAIKNQRILIIFGKPHPEKMTSEKQVPTSSANYRCCIAKCKISNFSTTFNSNFNYLYSPLFQQSVA